MLKWINSHLHHNKEIEDTIHAVQKIEHMKMLPGNMAARILDLEYQCQGEQTNQQLIASLIALYTEAIEYYESIHSKKYLIYKKRMQMFLSKSNIDDILWGKSGKLVSRKECAEKTICTARIKSKSQVTRILEVTEKKVKKSRIIVEDNLKTQEKRLEERIHKRKTMSNRSSATCEDEQQNEQLNATPVKSINNLFLSHIILRNNRQDVTPKGKRIFI